MKTQRLLVISVLISFLCFADEGNNILTGEKEHSNYHNIETNKISSEQSSLLTCEANIGKGISDERIIDSCSTGLGGSQVYCFCEEMPEFPGGEKARIKYLKDNIIYPQDAKENGIQGWVYISFIIDTGGDVTEVKILRGLCESIDKVCLRATESMPDWSPGYQAEKKVNIRFSMGIKFVLIDDNDVSRLSVIYRSTPDSLKVHRDNFTKRTNGVDRTAELYNSLSNENPDEIKVRIYPNPAADYFFIKTENEDRDMQFMVFDVSGNLVNQGHLTDSEEKYSTAELKSGSYIIKLFSGSKPVKDLRLIIAK